MIQIVYDIYHTVTTFNDPRPLRKKKNVRKVENAGYHNYLVFPHNVFCPIKSRKDLLSYFEFANLQRLP